MFLSDVIGEQSIESMYIMYGMTDIIFIDHGIRETSNYVSEIFLCCRFLIAGYTCNYASDLLKCNFVVV